MKQQKNIFPLGQTSQNYYQISSSHKEETETSKQVKFSQLFLHKKMSRKNLERGKQVLWTAGEEQKKMRVFHRKQVNYKIMDGQSMSTTHRSVKEALEDYRIKILVEKLSKILFGKAFSIIHKKNKEIYPSRIDQPSKKPKFSRKEMSFIDPCYLTRMSILAFPLLNEKIDDLKAHFMTKMQLLYRRKPIKQYEVTIIFLLVRMQVRRRLSNLGFALHQLKGY